MIHVTIIQIKRSWFLLGGKAGSTHTPHVKFKIFCISTVTCFLFVCFSYVSLMCRLLIQDHRTWETKTNNVSCNMFIKNSTLINFTLVRSTDWDVKGIYIKGNVILFMNNHAIPTGQLQDPWDGRSTLSSCSADDAGCLVRILIQVILTDLFTHRPSQPLMVIFPSWRVTCRWFLITGHPVIQRRAQYLVFVSLARWLRLLLGDLLHVWLDLFMGFWYVFVYELIAHPHNPTVSSDG